MKKILYVLNDCMRRFSFERFAGLSQALRRMEEPACLYVLRSDTYADFAPEHNHGEYNIYRLPDYRDFDGILLDINSIFSIEPGAHDARGPQYAVQAALASGKPVISMANRIEGVYFVGIDNYGAMTSVIRHLHRDLGLTDFWFALGPPSNYENQVRARALRDYCQAHGLPCGEDRFFAESFVIECGVHAFEQLRARHGGALPQAVVCANDHIATGICHAARAAGFDVPRDFLVTGFDNTDLSAVGALPLTTVDQQGWRMGDACLDALQRIWRGEPVPRVIHTPTRLVLRESTGHGTAGSDGPRADAAHYIGSTSSDTDFNYKLRALQYRLPGCNSIEDICTALVDCVSALNCDGVRLVLDSRLSDPDRLIEFREQIGRVRDTARGMPVEGYADTLTLAFSWEAGGPPRFPHQRVGGRLYASGLEGAGENLLFAPLHFMEYTVGYLCLRGCVDLMRIRGVSSIVSTLTMALRAYYTRESLSYVNHVMAGLSMKDGLTGLYNRLGYHELAYPLFRKAAGEGGQLAILFMDMDRLKHINDSYGHAVGDLAIRSVANAILGSAPPEAIPVRYGGDEFLVLMPGDDRAATALLDRIARAIPAEAAALGVPEAPGVSSGHVLTEPESDRPLEAYVQQADRLMYENKRARKARM